MKLQEWIQAYGTSEGASKGWDTRGRGKKRIDYNNYTPRAAVRTVLKEQGFKRSGSGTWYKRIGDENHKISVSLTGAWNHSSMKGPAVSGPWEPRKEHGAGDSESSLADHLETMKMHTGAIGKYRYMTSDEKRRIDETHIKDSET